LQPRNDQKGFCALKKNPISASISEVRVVLVPMNEKENNIKDE
jgi:hypothetical protein